MPILTQTCVLAFFFVTLLTWMWTCAEDWIKSDRFGQIVGRLKKQIVEMVVLLRETFLEMDESLKILSESK